jgi:hypothetical protein
MALKSSRVVELQGVFVFVSWGVGMLCDFFYLVFSTRGLGYVFFKWVMALL